MKFTSSQKIGIFVVATIIAIFFLINFLKGQDLFRKKNRYYTTLQDVEGLSATSPVYIRGLKVGTIESIKFLPAKDSFLLKMSVKSDYALPIDSRIEIYSSDLLGGKSLRIGLGTAGIQAKNGDTLKGKNIPDMMSLVYKAAGPLKDKVYELIDNLNGTLNNINTLLDSSTKRELQASAVKLHSTLANAEELAASLNTITPELKSTVGNMNRLTYNLNSPNGDLSRTLSNLNSTSEQLAALKLNESIDELNKLLKKMQDPGTTMGKLMTTDELHNSVDSLANEINDLVKKIKENPKKYIRLTVF